MDWGARYVLFAASRKGYAGVSQLGDGRPRTAEPTLARKMRTRSASPYYVDAEVLAVFHARAHVEGQGYQTLMSVALRQSIMPENAPVTLGDLRRVLHEE